jgi:anti-anti-sigma regulatory factor
MSFRIDVERKRERIVLRVQGALVGWEAEQVLREQIVAAVSERPEIVLDLRELTAIDPGCLGALESGLIGGVSIEGGGAYVETLLRK